MKAKCASCGLISELPDGAKKFVCPGCGVLNTPQPEGTGSGEEACGCLLPNRMEWLLPAGKIEYANGITHYTTADDGTGLTRQEWIETFGVDPEVVLKKMRANKGVRKG